MRNESLVNFFHPSHRIANPMHCRLPWASLRGVTLVLMLAPLCALSLLVHHTIWVWQIKGNWLPAHDSHDSIFAGGCERNGPRAVCYYWQFMIHLLALILLWICILNQLWFICVQIRIRTKYAECHPLECTSGFHNFFSSMIHRCNPAYSQLNHIFELIISLAMHPIFGYWFYIMCHFWCHRN